MKSNPWRSSWFSGFASQPNVLLGDLLSGARTAPLPVRLTARGISMAPFIRDGDVITLRPCRDCPPRTGDVVAFVHPVSEQLLIHRVLAMNGCSFMTQGDNAPVNDGMIPEERVLGRVVAVERNGTRVRFGLGVERFLIVVLVRSKLLHLLLSRLHECA